MELVKILSSVIKENRNSRMNLTEISNTLMNQLLIKFKDETEDTEDKMKEYINSFERYKNGLPSDKRDITKYTYDELKSLITSKSLKKEEKDLFKAYMQGPGKGSDQRQVKSMIKRFLEIRDLLPAPNRDIHTLNWLN